MTRQIILSVIFLLTTQISLGQNPKFKLTIDCKPSFNLDNISVFFWANNKYYNILDKKTSEIIRPTELSVDSIESIKIIIYNDTLEYFDTKSIREKNFPPPVKEVLMPKYKAMLEHDKVWDIYVDNFPFENRDVLTTEKEIFKELKVNKKQVQFVVLQIINSQVGHRILKK